jgi:hypothetical protein
MSLLEDLRDSLSGLLVRLAIVTGVAVVEFAGVSLADAHEDRISWAVGGTVWLAGVAGSIFWLYRHAYPAMQRQLPIVLLMISTGVAAMGLAGVRLSSDRADWLIWMVAGAWVAGAAGCIYDSWWLTALPGQIVVRLIIITGIAGAGVRLSGDRADRLPWAIDWSNWAVIGVTLIGIASAIYWLFGFYYRFWWTVFELMLVAGLAASVVAGIWLLNEHPDWLPRAIAGAWLVGVAGCLYWLYEELFG